MNFTVASVPIVLHVAAALMVAAILWRHARHVDWRYLIGGTQLHHAAGGMLVIAMLWSLKGQLAPGFNLHLIGATLATLVFGLPLASFVLLGGAIVAALAGQGDWPALPLNVLTAALLPAWISTHVLHAVERRLPAHFFVYIFLAGCLNATIGVLAVGVVATAVLALSHVQPLSWLLTEYAPFFLLLAFAESWLTGMALTLMVVYRPGWVASFDDHRYLEGK
ncbi:energy-coupling factor ABC transporter permease [Uliginosibacterium sp. sgz301328]|uniref:energy-coupling factor ABC transporter permease n=1 Tax=Uliginosibacterium sp. sgz301328 TaxID=3243764 RepID=UPI00359D02E4